MTSPAATRAAVVILAAGVGSRVGAETNKVLLPLGGTAILTHSVRTVLEVAGVHRVVLVVRPEERDAVRDAVAPHLGAHDLWVVDGGDQRHDSEWRALQALARDIDAGELDVVAVHDGARPLATPGLWAAVIAAAAEHGGAIPVVPSPRLSRRDGSLAPEGLVGVQTPQAFRAEHLLAAYRRAKADGFTGSDTASCLEHHVGRGGSSLGGVDDLDDLDGVRIVGVPGEASNLKVTFPEDVALAEELLSGERPG